MLPLKKILIAIAFIVFSIGVGYGIYYIFFRPAPVAKIPVNEEAGEKTLPGAGLPQAGEAEKTAGEEPPPGVSLVARGGLTLVSSITKAGAIGASLSSDGKMLNYYDKNDGKFYRLTADGNALPISSKIFYEVKDVTWSPGKNKAVLEYPDGSNIIYDFNTQNQYTLPKHWEDFSFSPDSGTVVAKSIDADPTNRWLVAINSDGTNMKTIELMGENDDKVQVNYSPNGQVVAFSSTGEAQGFSRQDILLIGMNGENYKALRVNGLGFQGKWSPSGNRLTYNVYSADTDYKPVLWITEASGENIGTNKRNIGLNTWVDKCAFADEKIMYCAVPQTLQRGAGFQPATSSNTPDVFYKVDTTTGIKTLIATPSENYTASNLMVSSDGQYLFFSNKQTEKIEKIRLK